MTQTLQPLSSIDDIDRELLQIDRELCERSLPEFLRGAWHVMEPEVEYLHNWHIDCIADYLAAVSAGDILRLIINMPPRYLKSGIVTTAWPTHEWTKNPSDKFMCTSYANDLSIQHSLDRRGIILSEWYQDRWGDVFQLTGDQNAKSHFINDRGGEMFSTSMSGAGTGFGCNKLIVDDPHNPKKAESDKERKNCINNFRKTFTRRLNDKKTGAIVGVMQRLHSDDLAGVALEMGYTHLCLEGEAKKRRFIMLPSSMRNGCTVTCDCATCTKRARDEAGRKGEPMPPEERERPKDCDSIERNKGEYLHEEREGAAEHAQAKIELGPEGYSHQYDQQANPEDGIKFKRKTFRYFEDHGDHFRLHLPNGTVKRVLKKECTFFGIVDTAMSVETTADYTVVGTMALTPDKDLLVCNINRDRMEDPEVEAAVRSVVTSGAVSYVGVEHKQNGMTLFQRLSREGFPIRAIEAKGDKLSRSTVASIDLANGKIYFLASALWLSDFENELLQFPNGAHDDQVDVLAYAAIEKSTELSFDVPAGTVGAYD